MWDLYKSDRPRLCLEEHIRNENPEGCGKEYSLRFNGTSETEINENTYSENQCLAMFSLRTAQAALNKGMK
jgi:hypothetical protein